MKKFRPYCAGFIVLYVLAVLCVGDAVWTMVAPGLGMSNDYMTSFSMFSYLIAALALLYVKMYAGSKVAFKGSDMQIVHPVYIRPEAGAKRAMFLYRQGDTDIKLMNKTFNLKELVKYGWIEDLNYSRLDASGVSEKNKLFPVHEIALVLENGKRYHLNGGFFSQKQLNAIVKEIHAVSGVEPTGKLKEYLK